MQGFGIAGFGLEDLRVQVRPAVFSELGRP